MNVYDCSEHGVSVEDTACCKKATVQGWITWADTEAGRADKEAMLVEG